MMSCIDSKTPKKRKNLQSENMGDVIGKEPDKTEIEEMSLEFTDSRPEREDADGAPSPEEPNMQNGDVINDSDEVELYEGCDKDETPCDCDACKDRRIAAAENLKEIRQLQAYWMELRQYIRMVYRMAMDGKCPTESFQAYIKDLVSKLCLCDPHQLFQRLESQVREFVIEAKVHQIELLHRDKDSPDLPKLFISGLLDSYKKLMTAAVQLVPLLEQLQNEHLHKFNLTWKVLNQHLYQSCVYTDPLVQNNVPTYISMLSNTSNEDAEANKKLVRDFLGFDDEITLVGGMWSDVETRIHRYNQEQATLKAKQKMLKEDWELFKATRKLIQQQKDWQSEISFGEAQQFDEHTWKVGDDSSCSHRTCPCDECAMNHLISCGGLVPLVPLSPTVPYSSHKAETGVRVEGEGREKVEASNDCECHVCTAPPETRPIDWESETVNLNLHLYPHIHGKDVSNGNNGLYHHLYNVYPSQSQNNPNDSPEDLEDPDIPILEKLRQNFIKKICEEVSNECPDLDDDEDDDDDEEEEEDDDDDEDEDDDDDEFRPTSPIGPPPPGPNTVTIITSTGIKQEVELHEKLRKHITTQTHAHQHPRLHQTLPDSVKSIPPPCHKHPEPIKRVMCPDHADEEEDTTPEDSCSERSSCSTQRDSRHCDCCYCEVFGHGVPSVAPVSRNYQEMRERLRLLLTKKKAKCKSATVPGNNNTSGNTGPPNNHPNGNSSGIVTTSTSNTSKSKDTRDLEDLLHFIEGNPNSKCKDEKKAAKKARQKQKKQEEIDRKKREEEEAAERRRLEEEAAAAALLKQQQKAQAKKKKKKNKVANNVNNNTNNNNNNTKSTKLNEQVPQMVTIKRVMEPNSAEPTVTITLRGATPNEDKVLYTLLNGQVCQVEKDSKNSKKQQGPAGNSKNKGNVNNGNSVVISNQNRFVNGQTGKNNKTTKKEVVNIKTTVNINNQLKKNENLKPKPVTPQLTNPTAIQINNAINRLSSRPPVPNFSLDNLKLPPGITITKVDPAQVSQRKPIQIKPSAPPPAPTPPPSVPASSNVIVVNTGRLKDLNNISDRGQSDDGSNGKKKKKKKGNGSENITTNNNNNIVTLSMNGGPKNLMTPPPLQNGKVMMSSQAAIIKVNGSMVTIRNPVLQQSMNVESETASDQSKKKKKKKKKGTNGKGQQDECVDSVFAPKDIDLENGDIDEGERELEAFKRFCLQSVPLKRKEKVHLNIKDIVLKKKSSAISCS
uniref:FAM193 C-terminal domain-containing protein n=1 Tax=Clastoptera arizonana TaxID=38151 RepID=A0A1B6DDP5_9HEMI